MTPDVRTERTDRIDRATGIARWQMPSLIVGIVGLLTCVFAWLHDPTGFFRAWLPSYMFWFSIAAGSLAVLMLQYVTGGEWGLMIRRPLGAAARTMGWMVLLFVPVALGLKQIYPWANPAWPGFHEMQEMKGWWLNPTRFLLFAAIYFGFFLLFAWRIRALSLTFYKDQSPYVELSRRRWAAAGLVLVVLVLSFASIDWMMSLEPKWNSTIYGITFVVGCGLSAFAFVTFFLTRLASTEAMGGVLKPSHLRDLGNLILAFVMFYAYTTFSEFLLIWYANTKEEIPHYLIRRHGTWGALAAAMILFHFFLPFFLLLMRPIKDRPQTIGIVTVIILVMRYVAIYWLIAPSWYGQQFVYSWMDLASLLGIGGIFMWAFISQLKGQSIIPIHETWVEEAIREGALKNNV